MTIEDLYRNQNLSYLPSPGQYQTPHRLPYPEHCERSHLRVIKTLWTLFVKCQLEGWAQPIIHQNIFNVLVSNNLWKLPRGYLNLNVYDYLAKAKGRTGRTGTAKNYRIFFWRWADRCRNPFRSFFHNLGCRHSAKVINIDS